MYAHTDVTSRPNTICPTPFVRRGHKKQQQMWKLHTTIFPHTDIVTMYRKTAGKERMTQFSFLCITWYLDLAHSSRQGNFFFNRKELIFFLLLQENIYCGYSLEAEVAQLRIFVLSKLMVIFLKNETLVW